MPVPANPAVPEGNHADSKSAFRASLAHDLRTPLNAMVGWLHLLTSAGEVSNEVRQRALAGLQRAVEEQRRVVATLDTPVELDDAPAPLQEQTNGRAAPGQVAGARDVALLKNVYILAIDDDPNILQMLQSLLEHVGATVESTTSPDEALRRYASWASGEGERIVLSDLAMHERDGISLIRSVRALERDLHLRRLPAIALSAHFRPDTRREAFEGGFDLFLAKPIDPSVLLNHLRSMLDR